MRKTIAASLCILLAGCATIKTNSDYPATVTFQFKGGDDVTALTFWRKRKDGGKRGPVFSIGLKNRVTGLFKSAFPPSAPFEEKLDPGLYYLDSFVVSLGRNSFYLSQSGMYWSRNGWDDENDEPLFLAFTARKGQKLTLPVVTIIVSEDEDTGWDTHFFEFSDPDRIFTVGKRANKL
ncbi:MAG: hypothetical protein FWF01_02380 [Alphaproteobacteria bacterium]|nr:hypothetical protein [Alphaproteobacteria bacterium]